MTKSTDGFWIEMSRLARRHGRRMNVDADDLAQSLAAAYLSQRHPVVEPGPWLERVARNLAVEAWRRQRREPLASPSLPETSAEPTACEGLVAEQERRAIEAACQALSSDERALLAKRFGDTARGAERTTSRPRSATERTRLRRVLLRLRQELATLRALWAPGSWVGAGQGMAALGVGGQLAVVAMLGSSGVGGLLASGTSLSVRPHDHQPAGPTLVAPRALAGSSPTTATGRVSSLHLAANDSGRSSVSVSPHPTRSRESTAPAPAPSPAPSASRVPSSSPASPGEPVPVKRIEYDNDAVEGDLQRPDVIFVPGLTGDKKASLIELRRDFVPELLKGLEDVT